MLLLSSRSTTDRSSPRGCCGRAIGRRTEGKVLDDNAAPGVCVEVTDRFMQGNHFSQNCWEWRLQDMHRSHLVIKVNWSSRTCKSLRTHTDKHTHTLTHIPIFTSMRKKIRTTKQIPQCKKKKKKKGVMRCKRLTLQAIKMPTMAAGTLVTTSNLSYKEKDQHFSPPPLLWSTIWTRKAAVKSGYPSPRSGGVCHVLFQVTCKCVSHQTAMRSA